MPTNKTYRILGLIALTGIMSVHAQWRPQGDRIKTKWADEIDTLQVLPEYPRPIMQRNEWKNLNGLWDFALVDSGSALPATFQEKILVPFTPESSLSGLQRSVSHAKELVYRYRFSIPGNWKSRNILLHFGAVDWRATISVNGKTVGKHEGGYAPFSFDITPFLQPGMQTLTVRVWDPTDQSNHPVGKQRLQPGGIWYSPVSGIWQTVWMEPVAPGHIQSVQSIPDIDNSTLQVKVETRNAASGDRLEVRLWDGETLVASKKEKQGKEVLLPLSNVKRWSPETPFLYRLQIRLLHKGKITDTVQSYAAMRKISLKKDAKGIVRMQLNNQDYFQYGLLDQGWWPDGLYTAPTDEALQYDILKTKEWGFNLIRKHVKTEPARWYSHCDSIGILVWQDMPSGGPSPEWQTKNYFNGKEIIRTPQDEKNYREEWAEIVKALSPYPCIVSWVPFNEAWGQFKTVEIAQWTKEMDPSRLVNAASGGNYYHAGDIMDIHHYPAPGMPLFDSARANLLGEYGGIGLPLPGHLWLADKNWGYVQFKTPEEVTATYCEYADLLKGFIRKGFDAAIYTQTTDVEGEINGLMTYDRKAVKINEEEVRKKNLEVRSVLQ